MDARGDSLTVSELTLLIKGTLESQFHGLWVSGEISEISRPHSGHIYFTLKDAQAQIRGVIWRSAAARIRFALEEGQEVLCQGDLDVYPPRGSYQLNVRQIEPRGAGALQIAFQQLLKRLTAEGLFEPSRKRPLPRFPQRVGFVTSPTGAAIRDFLEVAARRYPGVAISVFPARVQGEGAAAEIVRGIELANRVRPTLDVLVVGRGGGSIEDLWCFNEEPVVRAIAASRVPVVSAVGHEIDVTLADLAADVRALTPSEAAERVIPSAEELTARLRQFERRMVASLRGRAAAARRYLEQIAKSRVLRDPRVLLYDRARRLDELEARATRAIERKVESTRQELVAAAARLEALSPLGVLARGYSVTLDERTGAVVRDASELSAGDLVRTRLAQGSFTSRVETRSE
ncbi:MAG: exodeoxyribonuclease VII large subunit [Pirellulaceae bacterium]|jgi:exodeoxyribonuclease VII large subunit|nr:exodeoxyribonuclease VII large subunit [Pirellulaceae bacterium]